MNRPINIANITKQGRKYLRIARWILRDTYFRPPFQRPLAILALSSMRLLCQVGAVAVLYYYANGLKNGATLEILSFNFPARESFALLWIVIITSSALFILTSVCQYFSRTVAIAMAGHYEEIFSKRAFNIVRRLPDPRVPYLNELILKQELNRIPADARRAGMTVRILGYGVPQMVSGLVALVSIIVIDPILTLLIGALMGAVFLGQYPANLKGAKYSDLFEKTIQKASKASAGLIRSLIADHGRQAAQSAAIDRLYTQEGLKKAIEVFGLRLQVIEESTLITQIGSAFVLSVAIFWIGSGLLNGDTNWGLLLIYIAALRATLSGFVSFGRLLTNVSRFYPQLTRFHQILSQESLLASEPAYLQKGDLIKLHHSSASGSTPWFDFKPPQRIAVYTGDSFDHSLLHLFNHALIQASTGQARPFDCHPIFVKRPNLEVRNGTVLVDQVALKDDDILMAEADHLDDCEPHLLEKWLHNTLVFVVYNDLKQPPRFDESLVLLWLGSKIQWAGPHAADELETLRKRFKPHFEANKRQTQFNRSESAEEFDEDVF